MDLEFFSTIFKRKLEIKEKRDKNHVVLFYCVVTKGNKTDQLSNSERALTPLPLTAQASVRRKLKDLLIKVDKSTSQPEKCLFFVLHKEIPPTH